MPVSKRIKEVSFGGSAVNNPTNYSWTTYVDYPNLDMNFSYQRMNIIYFEQLLSINLQVTGLVVLDTQGNPLLGPNDLVYLPCPPACP
jgi:hypothetical protein